MLFFLFNFFNIIFIPFIDTNAKDLTIIPYKQIEIHIL